MNRGRVICISPRGLSMIAIAISTLPSCGSDDPGEKPTEGVSEAAAYFSRKPNREKRQPSFGGGSRVK